MQRNTRRVTSEGRVVMALLGCTKHMTGESRWGKKGRVKPQIEPQLLTGSAPVLLVLPVLVVSRYPSFLLGRLLLIVGCNCSACNKLHLSGQEPCTLRMDCSNSVGKDLGHERGTRTYGLLALNLFAQQFSSARNQHSFLRQALWIYCCPFTCSPDVLAALNLFA